MNDARIDDVVEVITIQKPQASNYVVYRSSSTASYITTSVDDSAPDQLCLGQIIKNNVLVD